MLDPETLLEQVCSDDPDTVAVALALASERGGELAPGILARLERAVAQPQEWIGEDKPFVGFLLHLAAEFRLTAAHGPITRLLRLDDDTCWSLLSDIPTGDAPAILADTYAGDPQPLFDLLDDSAAGVFQRGAGLEALAILVHRGAYPRQALLDRMVAIAQSLDPDACDDPLLGNMIVESALQLHAVEIRETVLALYERGVAEEMYVEPDYVEKSLRPDAPPAREARDLERRIDRAWTAVQNWAFFRGEMGVDGLDEPIDLEPGAARILAETPLDDPGHTPYRAPPKVGRNDPCPCGSGRKFKKCCGG